MSILKLLSTNGFISYNKTVAKLLGVHEAILLGELCSIGDLYNYNEFFFERDKIINDTALSDSQIRNATKTLVEYELVTVVKKGIPCKYYYTLNEQKILELFSSSATEIKALVLQKEEDLSSNNLSTFNNKNTNKNTIKNTSSADAPIQKPKGKLIETEQKVKKPKENGFIEVVNKLCGNEIVKDALMKYCSFRRSRGLTVQQWELIVSKFKQDSQNKTEQEVLNCIDQCIVNGRNSLYYSDYSTNNNKQQTTISDDNPAVIKRNRS